jgi:dTDP-4-dehydrorhamnose reductase
MNKYYIFGITGLIGKSLAKEIKASTVLGSGREIDICNHQLVLQKLIEYQPNVIFFCANNSGGVERCENDPVLANTFHFEAVKNIVDYCKKNKTTLVFFSSTYVFGETPQSPPLSNYGICKLKSEKYIKNNLSSYLIIRTVNVYGEDKLSKSPNFYQQILNHLEAHQEFFAAENILAYPTEVKLLTDKTLILLNQENWGIHLVVGNEITTRFEWAKNISNNSSLIRPFTDTTNYRPKKQRFTNGL